MGQPKQTWTRVRPELNSMLVTQFVCFAVYSLLEWSSCMASEANPRENAQASGEPARCGGKESLQKSLINFNFC